jgi:hypothetical protein
MVRIPRCCRSASLAALLPALLAAPLAAQVEPEKLPLLAEKQFRHPDLDIPTFHLEVRQLPAAAAASARGRLARLGVDENAAFVDQRGGRFVTLLPATPLVPGRGVGNDLTWGDLREAEPKNAAAAERAALSALRSYLEANRYELGIDPAELGAHRMGGYGNGELYQIYLPRFVDGIPVRGSYLTAVIGQGNLTLFGAEKWGDRPAAVANEARLGAKDARQIAEGFMTPLSIARDWAKPELEWIPVARGKTANEVPLGKGYGYRLAWSVKVQIEGDGGHWEVLVDAKTGEILASEDKNVYAEAKGGVYPLSNDGLVPDGVEQHGWPMPFLNLTGGTTDTGGNANVSGNLTATLTGPYVRMSDNCGPISLTQSGNLDFGASSGTDCATPGFGGAGNTHSSRSGFYELNKLAEMARGQLPANTWLTQQLTANMNINQTCNAFWGGGTVNFYRSGGGCFNTGEIAAVFDHEWGHGLDDNDINGSIASPSGEGIADIYSALRLNDSCIGRNFRPTVCNNNGDPCLTCTGVRDIDYLKRQSGTPHHFTWSNANCGGSVHCVGGVYSEAIWSLWKRKLASPPYSLDSNTAHELVTRLSYIAGGNIGTWFSGSPPNGGCAASSGYMNYLAADDDNGNLNDGTPRMTAIFQSFNDQQIACGTPTVQDSGCANTPSVAPNVVATAGSNTVGLSWNAVANATKYQVYRTEGVQACNFGKVKLGETTGLAWNDANLQNGRSYSYVVIPIGAHNTCMGPASACDTVAPIGAPDFAVSCAPNSASVQQGATASSTCTVTALYGYTGTVGLSCSGAPAGVSCGFAPASVSPTGTSTLTLTVALAQAPGNFNFNIVGNDGAASRTAAFSLLVTPQGQNGPQTAVYDSTLGAPKCALPGSSCSSTTLLDGRNLLGPEPNQPNTVDACTDGASGTYHSDESNDRIVVSTLDGFDFAEGATVRIDATVWAWSTGSSDRLDLYYAANANSPSWTFITTLTPPAGGAQTLSAQYTLPAGGLQAVRANFRYNGTASACSGGAYDDADDLVFAVNAAAPQCTTNAQCDDGLFCNGAETCSGGSCQAGTNPCTVGQTCNETTNSCQANPVTVTFTSIAADDGYVIESGENTNAGGTATSNGSNANGLRVGDTSQDRQQKSVVSFDTASIPDGAVITGVTLRLRRGDLTGTNPFSTHGTCWADIVSGSFSGSAALQTGDFQAAATATQVASMSNPAANLDWSTGNLNAAGLAALNKTGLTQLRVYFNTDDNDDNGNDYLGFYPANNGTAANRPQLVVTYLP